MKTAEMAGALKAAAAAGAEALSKAPGVYAASVKHADGALFATVRLDDCKRLAVIGKGRAAERFEGESVDGVKLCPLNAANAAALRETFPWTAPVTIGRRASFGVGDRLGVATPGHLRAFARYDIFPVLAQQSMRELGRTERKPQDVIDDAGWGAFQAGWTGTFAADADHIKQVHEVLDCWRKGYTMFTIDASEHINAAAVRLPDDKALEQFAAIPDSDGLRARFIGKEWNFKGDGLALSISFTPDQLARCALVYHRAVEHMTVIYRELCAAAGNPVEAFDFEVSVDETDTDTTVQDHVFVAVELAQRGVKWQSLAPKFTGEFQKGIDYRGDRAKFEQQFAAHALIARELGGYKVSVHSGSDKFSIFPTVGKYTGGYFHLKTAGTSWLEAVRVVAQREPGLYRELHTSALANFEKDRASYHVTTNLAAIPDLSKLKDSELPELMEAVDSRQLLHITYGSLLSGKKADGSYIHRDRFFRALHQYEEDYCQRLDFHIGRHMETLGVPARV